MTLPGGARFFRRMSTLFLAGGDLGPASTAGFGT